MMFRNRLRRGSSRDDNKALHGSRKGSMTATNVPLSSTFSVEQAPSGPQGREQAPPSPQEQAPPLEFSLPALLPATKNEDDYAREQVLYLQALRQQQQRDDDIQLEAAILPHMDDLNVMRMRDSAVGLRTVMDLVGVDDHPHATFWKFLYQKLEHQLAFYSHMTSNMMIFHSPPFCPITTPRRIAFELPLWVYEPYSNWWEMIMKMPPS